ncbi:MAG: glycerol acyltransferase [Bacteroidales bacterium]|nr:glycerol acyltransferase [Bacteroidales bacterium]
MPELLQLDLDSILRSRMPERKRGLLPRFATRALEKLIRQDELNHLLREAYPARGSAFSSGILRILDITVDVKGLEKLSPEGRYVFASNHPLGGLDGITLISLLGSIYGDDKIRFPVNDLLMNVEPLSPVFLPVNKYGSQGRGAALALGEAYRSDAQILIFPAGLVSRLGPEGVRDLEWHKAFVAKAMETDRSVVPVHFKALNRMRFYKLAKWRKKLGIKVNVEQAMLPAELCAAKGAKFEVVFGTPISSEELRAEGKSPTVLASEIRSKVYGL